MTDLDIIKQLERKIGKQLQEISLDKIASRSNGYAVDKDKNVVGLNLDKNEFYAIPNIIVLLRNLKKLSIVDTKQPPAKDGWVRGLAAESRDTGRPSPVVIKE
ncbi:hypothetical protein, partial [Candidatus Albibeggiatoa sp. nov. BB20]|uniref:hypothetical protein n=1 Tax=Candidatus Albibeggiatoa sp. nov. BB20 TaxID=3162723 RepID=UPI0033653FE7